MYQTRIAFARDEQASEFDRHLASFLRMCDLDPRPLPGYLSASRHSDDGFPVRIVKSDSARMLGRFQNFLTNRASPLEPSGWLLASG